MNWAEWSRDAVSSATGLNMRWQKTYGLDSARYFWDLEALRITFQTQARSVEASICVVGTASDEQDSFLWAWANPSLSHHSTQCLAKVRKFGEDNDLPLLTTGGLTGGTTQGKECAAIAAKILQAEGVFIDQLDGYAVFFTLSQFREVTMPAD